MSFKSDVDELPFFSSTNSLRIIRPESQIKTPDATFFSYFIRRKRVFYDIKNDGAQRKLTAPVCDISIFKNMACQIGLLPVVVDLKHTKLQPKNKAGIGIANRAAYRKVKNFVFQDGESILEYVSTGEEKRNALSSPISQA